jgi:hypothetical protein
MKAQYVGDIGDLGKLLLLKHLAGLRLKIGVNWILTENDDRSDGKHRDYIRYGGRDCLCCCDEELYENMLPLAKKSKNDRRIDDLERVVRKQCGIDSFYSELFNSVTSRKSSDDGAFAQLKPQVADLVFFDPDNGIDLQAGSSAKHVYLPELKRYWHREQSLLVYHHLGRAGTHEVQIMNLTSALQREFPKSTVNSYWLRRGTARAYFLILQSKHCSTTARQEAIPSLAPLQISKAGWAPNGKYCTKIHSK